MFLVHICWYNLKISNFTSVNRASLQNLNLKHLGFNTHWRKNYSFYPRTNLLLLFSKNKKNIHEKTPWIYLNFKEIFLHQQKNKKKISSLFSFLPNVESTLGSFWVRSRIFYTYKKNSYFHSTQYNKNSKKKLKFSCVFFLNKFNII